MVFVFLALAIISEVAGTVFMRLSYGFTKKRWILPVVLAYAVALTMLMLVLQQGMALGVAYGIWAASGIALTAIVARILFKDPLTKIMCLGVLFIIVGVLFVELGAAH